MKKFLLSLIILSSLILPSFAKAPLSYITNGTWGFYTDNRTANEVYRGYLVLNDDEQKKSVVYLRVVTNPKKPKTDIHYAVDVIYGENNEPVIGNVYNIQGFTKETLDDENIIQSALDILNFDIMYTKNVKKIGYDTTLEDYWNDSYVQLYHFNKALPGFRFDYINEKGYDGDVIKMDRYGIATSDKDIEEFFKIKKDATKVTAVKKEYKFEEAKAVKAKLSGVTYNLDENWTYKEATETTAEMYFLKKYTEDDAKVVIEDVSKAISIKNEDEMIFFANLLIFSSKTIRPQTIKADYTNKMLTLSFVTVNEDEGNREEVEFYKMTSKGKVIELGAIKKCYDDNKEYFDNIIKTAK